MKILLLEDKLPSQLEAKINKAIEEGWAPAYESYSAAISITRAKYSESSIRSYSIIVYRELDG